MYAASQFQPRVAGGGNTTRPSTHSGTRPAAMYSSLGGSREPLTPAAATVRQPWEALEVLAGRNGSHLQPPEPIARPRVSAAPAVAPGFRARFRIQKPQAAAAGLVSRPNTSVRTNAVSSGLFDLGATEPSPAAAAQSFETCSSTDAPGEAGLAASTVLAEDRERHRQEMDAVWRKERATAAKCVEVRKQLNESLRRNSELHAQLLSVREAQCRRELERDCAEMFTRVAAATASSAMRLLASLQQRSPPRRPPVRDSELLRALRRAEQRVMQLERAAGLSRGSSGHALLASPEAALLPGQAPRRCRCASLSTPTCASR
jgi:hypothetical protein